MSAVLSEPILATPDEDQTYRKLTWRLAPILFACYVVAYIDRVNVGFAKLRMLGDLHLSAAAYGFGAGLFFVGYFFFEVPSNLILYKVGARKWIARIMVSWAVVSAATAFVDSTTTFYLARFLLGAAEAGLFPGIVLYMTLWYPAKKRAHILALFLAGIPISGVIGGPVSGVILAFMNGVHGLSGWQWLYIIEAIPSLAIAIVVLLYLDDRVEDAEFLTEREKALLLEQVKYDNDNASSHSLRDGFLSPKVWFLCLVYFLFIAGLYGVGFWLPTLIENLGIANPLHVGIITAIPYAAGVVAMVIVSRSSDRKRERRWHLVIPGVIGTAGWLLSIAFHSDPVMAIISLSIATAAVMVTIPQFWCLPSAMLAGAAAEAVIAVINSVGNLSGFVTPWIIGLIIDRSGSTSLGVYLLAAALFAGSMLVLLVSKKLVNR
jgi:sugar phosphate permease